MESNLTLMDVLLWPVVMTVVGVAIWIIGRRLEEDDASPLIKWACAPFLLFGLFKGFDRFTNVVGNSTMAVMYRDVFGGRKMLIAHYLAFFLPLIAIIALVAWYVMDKRSREV